MSFFEPPPPPPPPEPGPPLPEWVGPPENVLPGAFPLELLLVRTPDVALSVSHGRAYPNGWQFVIAAQRRTMRNRHDDPFVHWHSGNLSDDVLRLGIALADGRKATVFDRPSFPGEGPPPEAVLRQGGGAGGATMWEFRMWAWPLPPEGPVAFVVEWPAETIPLMRVEIDAAPIREAAARAQELWPAEPPAGAWTRHV